MNESTWAFQAARLLQAAGPISATFAAPFVVRPDPDADDLYVIGLTSTSRRTAQERFVSLHLDTRCRLLSIANISEGSLTACPVDPKVVFSTALLAGATRIILAHNHPSGDPAPSPEDLDLTERLCDAGELLGIRVDDHVIIGGHEHQSIRELCPRLFR